MDYTASYKCGPIEVTVTTPTEELREKIEYNFNLYNVPWPETEARIRLRIKESDTPCKMLTGNYLTAQRTNVDITDYGLAATSPSGASAVFRSQESSWLMTVPPGPLEIWPITDIEHLLSLVVSTAWRRAGWVPLHAGAVIKRATCAILCATSGGGKTTLTAALIRRKWKTLGDDKLLLKKGADASMRLRALVHAFNLYPHAKKWFPEIGDLTPLPRYSIWTEKRKVRIEDIWPGRTTVTGVPTHIVSIVQDETVNGIKILPLASNDVLSTLMRQTVIPTHRKTAGFIVDAIASTAKRLTGVAARIGPDAYDSFDLLNPLEKALL